MTREGAPLVRALVTRGHRVFLDLKWHDIPNTVAGAVRAARELGVAMATVHTLGGRTMMEAATEASGGVLELVGVTVLTSHDAGVVRPRRGPGRRRAWRRGGAAGGRGRRRWARGRGLLARGDRRSCGGSCPDGARVVVPGIRAESDPAGDQVRVATAADAAAAGATHLVVGRPILQAADPARGSGEVVGGGPVRRVPDLAGPAPRLHARPTRSRCSSPRRPSRPGRPGSLTMHARWWRTLPGSWCSFPGRIRPSPWGRRRRPRCSTDFMVQGEEVETVVRAAKEVEPGRGYVELQRSYRVAGTQDVRTQSLLLGYRLLSTGWRLVELRIVG